MGNFKIYEATNKDMEIIDDGIVEYNGTKVPYTQENPFIKINRVISNKLFIIGKQLDNKCNVIKFEIIIL